MITNLLDQAIKNPPSFHLNRLCVYQDWINGKYFLDQSEYIKATNIDVSRVIGHEQGYGEMSWLEMLHGLKRIESNLKELARNPTYYLSCEEKPHWSFVEVDDKIFISSGKHRTTVLRYLAHYNPEHFKTGPIARGVQLFRRHLDYETMDLVNAINQRIEAFPHLSFRYIGGHMGERRWQLSNQSQNSFWNLTRGQIEELSHDLSETSFIKRLIGRGYQACFRESMCTGLGPNLD